MAETPPLDREFTITRVFDRRASWYGRRGRTQSTCRAGSARTASPRRWRPSLMDVRPGSTFEFTMVSDDDGNEIPSGGTFLEVVEPERLVWRDRDIDLMVTVTFADLGERTEMTCHVVGRTGGAAAYDGWSTMFDKLAEVLG